MILPRPQLEGKQARSSAPWRRLIIGLLASWLIGLPVKAQDSGRADIISLRQLSTLETNRAAQGLSVKMKGVVVCFDAEWNQFYFHDGVETAYLNPAKLKTQPKVGQAVEITGTTALIEGNSGFTNLNLSVLGSGILPLAKHLEVSELSREYGHWIEITGWVRVAEASSGRLRLSIQGTAQDCIVYVMGSPNGQDFKWLMDRKVRIRGVNASKIASGKLISAAIFAPSVDHITILEQPAADPFAAPVVSIGSLLNRELGSWTNNRVHVSGSVSTCVPGEYLTVKDPTGLIQAQVSQVDLIKPNDRAEIWGFLRTTANGPVLENSYFAGLNASLQTRVLPEAPAISKSKGLFATLTNISDIRRLQRDEAALHLPIRVRGVITFADPDWQTAFIQDSGGGIFFSSTQKEVRPGQWAELTGESDPGGFVPQAINSKVRILGTTNFPQVVRVDLQDLANGKLDAHWVEMEGIVRRVDEQWGHAYLTVVTRSGRFKALIPGLDDSHPPNYLIDALVTVQGVCGSELNQQRQLVGIALHVPGLDHVRIVDPAPENPFAIDSTRIAAVATFDPDHMAGRRQKVSGIVTLTIPGDGFVLQDSSGGMRIHTKQTNELQVGESVEVLGFPTMGGFSPNLEESIFRQIGKAGIVDPKRTTAEQILSQGTNDQIVVRIKGRLLQSVTRSASPEFVLQDGPIIFTARTQSSMRSPDFSNLRPGSLLELTGICSMQGGEEHEASGFRLLLRRPEDIKLLQGAAWWTDSRIIWVAGALLAVLLMTASWGAVLSRKNQLLKRTQLDLHEINDDLESRVELRTRDLKSEIAVRQQSENVLAEERKLLRTLIDNLPVYIYIKDTAGRFLVSNLPHWKLRGVASEAELIGKTVFDFCPPEDAKRYDEDDQRVIRSGEPIVAREESAGTGEKCMCHLTTKIPLRDLAGNITGLIGVSQDITERKRAEAELENAHKELIEISRQAGMAEVATGVLHNVGNVLNSVNVSSSCAIESIRKSKISNLSRVVALLRKHEADLGGFVTSDPTGKQLPAYLATLAEHLSGEQAETLKELAHLQKNIEHIKDIITMQQSFAKVSGLTETLKPATLVEDALKMNASALARHDINVIKDFKCDSPVTVEKHKVLQILINLIRNAKHACNDSGRTNKQLTVRIANGDGRVRISVSDNGVGIPPENLNRIFNHGFTTKKNGHGFGLHSGALAARELGGSLSADSEGEDRGAIFTLELPVGGKANA